VDFHDEDSIQNSYYPDIENLILANVRGAQMVFIFDHCIRRVSLQKSDQRPVRKVHIDQTPMAAEARFRLHVPPEIQEKLPKTTRVRLINVWRPVRGPVLDHPLAMAESASVAEEDLVNVAHKKDGWVGETLAVKHSPKQRFWYWSRMNVDEVLLLQCYDSSNQADASPGVRCAHASFETREPDGEKAGNLRESIEVRCIVVG
jgi:hypothetical protein